jgi:hypothetical protein
MTRLLVSLFALGLLTITLSHAQAPVAQPPSGKIPNESCVKPCMDCAAECQACAKHCRDNKMIESAQQCEVCYHACLMCASAVASKNPRAEAICAMCEAICNDTAAVCEKGAAEQMKKCATACRTCAKACADARK